MKRMIAVSALSVLLILALLIGCPNPTAPPDGGGDTVFVLEDFEGTAPAVGAVNYNAFSAVIDMTTIQAYAANGTETSDSRVLAVLNTEYNTVPTVTVTLPAATSLSDYDGLRVDYFGFGGDASFKSVYLFAAVDIADSHAWGTTVGSDDLVASIDGNPMGALGAWDSFTFDLTNVDGQTLITALDGEATLELGIGASTAAGGFYLLDNITLIEPNSTEHVIEDFDVGSDPTIGVLNWNAGRAIVATESIQMFSITGNADSTGAMIVLNTNWNCVPKVAVTMPTARNLSDFSVVEFDYFALAGDIQYKNIFLYGATSLGQTWSTTVGVDDLLAATSGYGNMGTLGAWASESFAIDAGSNPDAQTLITALDGEATLELGLGADAGSGALYIIDNISVAE